nr:hypothetical protein [Polymorphobacter sp.]
MIRVAATGLLLALAACHKAPDPAATATARDIDAGMRKAVEDTDAARGEATAPRPLAAREQTTK